MCWYPYLAAAAVVERFSEDPAYAQQAAAARERFREEIDFLREACKGTPLDIMSDICVVFHCVAAASHLGATNGKVSAESTA